MQQKGLNFFSPSLSENTERWQVIYLGMNHSLFFDSGNNMLLGLGSPMDFREHRCPWQFALNPNEKVKQIAANDNHILILYQNGTLEGYGRSDWGELGLGQFSGYASDPLSIVLPDRATPIFIAAGKFCSFVIADNQHLYGFGWNQCTQLGLENCEYLPFPTKIPLPSDCVPEQVFSNHHTTVVVGKNNIIYGFGDQSSYHFGNEGGNKLQLPPLRLKHFEAHLPKAIAIGKHALVILAENGECFFYGVRGLPPIPWKGGKVRLPANVQVEQISYTDDVFLLLSNENKLWQAASRFPEPKFEEVNLSSRIKKIHTGYDSFCVMTDTGCYVWGSNQPYKKRHERVQEFKKPQPLYLQSTKYSVKSYVKSPSFGQNPNNNALVKQMGSTNYLDNTLFIEKLEDENTKVLEIISPAKSGKSSLILMLQQFYVNHEEKINCFEDKLIWQNSETRLCYGNYPVIVLDLARLDFSCLSQFNLSLKQLMSEWYLHYRRLLFTGFLKDNRKKQEAYQLIAMETNPFTEINGKNLRELIHYLSSQYQIGVKLFIDNAALEIKNNEIREKLIQFIDFAIADNPCLSKVVIFSEYPTLFSIGNKKSESINTSNSTYAPYFVSREIKVFDSRHPLFTAKISKDSCSMLEELLEHNQLIMSSTLRYSPYFLKQFLFSWLVFGGFLYLKTEKENTLACISNDIAREALQQLLNNGRIQNQKRITFAVDIDNWMTTTDSASKQTALFFLKKGAILSAYGTTHYIPPGRKEFTQFLFSLPETRIVFFSSGNAIRNQDFVKAFLIKALGKESYLQIQNNLLILSRNNCSPNDHSMDVTQGNNFELSSNKLKKDLNFCITPNDCIENACLIDNDPGVVSYGQEGNYLFVETITTEIFEQLSTLENFEENPKNTLFRILNDVFRVTALIANCIKVKDKQYLCELLFPLHFKPNNILEKTFTPRWKSEHMGMELYKQGLAILQAFNPLLTFITPQSYKLCIEENTNEREEKLIQEAKENEYHECFLM